MNLIQICLLVLAGISLAACQSTSSSRTNAQVTDSTGQAETKPPSVADLEKQVLATHDSVMPAMSDLMRLKKEVNQQLADLANRPPSTDVRQRTKQGLTVRAELEKADQSMMDWMHQYNGDTLAKLDQLRALAYLKDEQQRIKAMSQRMHQSITDAQTYLKARF